MRTPACGSDIGRPATCGPRTGGVPDRNRASAEASAGCIAGPAGSAAAARQEAERLRGWIGQVRVTPHFRAPLEREFSA